MDVDEADSTGSSIGCRITQIIRWLLQCSIRQFCVTGGSAVLCSIWEIVFEKIFYS
jgi:hypothetical protein